MSTGKVPQGKGWGKNKSSRGSILIFSLVILIALAAVVTSFLSVVLGTNQTTADQANSAKALYAAEAGLNKGMTYFFPGVLAPDGSTGGTWRSVSYPQMTGAPADPATETLDAETSYTIWVRTKKPGQVTITSMGTCNGNTRTVQVVFDTVLLAKVANTWKER